MEGIFDINTADELIKKLEKTIKTPHVKAVKSTLGGEKNVSVLLSVGFEPKETWANNIFQNSKYATFHISQPNVIEQVTKNKIQTKFRKSRAKNIDDAVKKINMYVEKVKKEKKNEGIKMSILDRIDERLDEAYQKVDIEGLPSIIMKGSTGTVRMQIKKKLKKPDDIKSIEKITVGDMKKYFRELAAGGGEEEASEEKVQEGRFVKGLWLSLNGRGGQLDSQFASNNNEVRKILMEWAKTGFVGGDSITFEKGESEI